VKAVARTVQRRVHLAHNAQAYVPSLPRAGGGPRRHPQPVQWDTAPASVSPRDHSAGTPGDGLHLLCARALVVDARAPKTSTTAVADQRKAGSVMLAPTPETGPSCFRVHYCVLGTPLSPTTTQVQCIPKPRERRKRRVFAEPSQGQLPMLKRGPDEGPSARHVLPAVLSGGRWSTVIP